MEIRESFLVHLISFLDLMSYFIPIIIGAVLGAIVGGILARNWGIKHKFKLGDLIATTIWYGVCGALVGALIGGVIWLGRQGP